MSIRMISADRNLIEQLSKRAESAEARAAQLETDNDEMQSYINEIRVALHTEKDELTIDAVRRVISERDELARKLEQAESTAKSNMEMWSQCDQQLRLVTADYIEQANTIRKLRETIETLRPELEQAQIRIVELERETKYFQSTDYAADRALNQALNEGDGVYRP